MSLIRVFKEKNQDYMWPTKYLLSGPLQQTFTSRNLGKIFLGHDKQVKLGNLEPGSLWEVMSQNEGSDNGNRSKRYQLGPYLKPGDQLDLERKKS